MKIRALPIMLAAVLSAPLHAVNFDGRRSRPDGDFVRAGSPARRWRARWTARNERANAAARARRAAAVAPPGVDHEAGATGPNQYSSADPVTSAVKGALIGVLVGSLFGATGLVAGPLVGAALFYGLALLASKD